jgi:hypothetical protein
VKGLKELVGRQAKHAIPEKTIAASVKEDTSAVGVIFAKCLEWTQIIWPNPGGILYFQRINSRVTINHIKYSIMRRKLAK